MNTNRRKFLLGSAGLAASTGSSIVSGKVFSETANNYSVVPRALFNETVRSVNSVGSIAEYKQFRSNILRSAVNPWQKECWATDESPCGEYFWALCGRTMSPIGEAVVLLDFWEFDCPNPLVEHSGQMLTFREWLQVLRPRTWDDYLMALPLYVRYIGIYEPGDEPIPTVCQTSDPWLSAFLRRTRGMLLWRSQFVELTRIATGSRNAAERLVKGYYLRQQQAITELSRLRYEPTGQPLLEIFELMRPRNCILGAPDYLVADWLRQAI